MFDDDIRNEGQGKSPQDAQNVPSETPYTEETQDSTAYTGGIPSDIPYAAAKAAAPAQPAAVQTNSYDFYNQPLTQEPILTQGELQPQNAAAAPYQQPIIPPYQPPLSSQPYQTPYAGQQTATKKSSFAGLKILCVILAVCLCLSVFVTVFALTRDSSPSDESATGDPNAPAMQQQNTPSNDTQSEIPADGTVLTTEQVAAKVRPSVVGIVVYDSRNQVAGEGSGIIMDEDKTGTYTYIITCAHVISDRSAKTFVQLENGKQYEAQYVGADKRTDLGVLRIKEKGLPKAGFGKSGALAVGSTVYAVGNPGGVEFFGSFTQGVVSAIGRDVSSSSGYTMECIQHDAAISPGNSGGALVNAYGQVIGINSMKIMGDQYEGMGFAIPMDNAVGIINKLIAKGYVPDRPKLGITYTAVSASAQYSMVVQANKLPAGSLIIYEISAESSLAGTKAQAYDMIIAVNGKDMDKADVLLELIEDGKVGDELTLTLCRVNSDYEISKFDVKIKLIEDKGDAAQESESTTKPDVLNPYD